MKTALAIIIFLSFVLGWTVEEVLNRRAALDLGGLTIIRKNPPKADRLIPTATSRPAKEFSI